MSRRRSWTVVDELTQDVQYALRTFRRAPGFTTVAVLTLALGIGANTGMFSVVHALVLKPLPFDRSDELFNVFQTRRQDGIGGTGWSYPNFAHLRTHTRAFSEMAGSQKHQLTLTGRAEPSVVDASVVTPELFSLLGKKPLSGRTLVSDDGNRGAAPVVVLSEQLWRRHFAADPNILGSSIDLDRRSFTVVGIMPASFRFPLVNGEQLWIPLAHDPLFGGWMEQRKGHWLQVTGRLRPDISLTQAQAEMDTIMTSLAQDFPAENGGWEVSMLPLKQMILGDVRAPLLVLLGAVGLVLLIACANISNLLLSRATSRAREIAVRATLGAGRARIVRQLLTEALVLGFGGGLAGIALAYGAVHTLRSMLPATVPQVNDLEVDAWVLGFALLLSIAAGCVFGLAPALFSVDRNLHASLRQGGGRTGDSLTLRRTRRLLAAGEVALTIVLLVVAGLLLRSFAKLQSVDPGFDAQQQVIADISLPRFQYATPVQWTAFADRFLAGLQAEPGLRDSAVVVPRPIVDGNINLGFDIVGSPPPSAGAPRTANYVSVSPGYFRVLAIPLVSGRLFDERDVSSVARVSIISEAMARRYFPNQDPLGKRLTFGFPPDGMVVREIVGVVGDVRDVALGQEPGPMMYVPFAQAPFWGANVVVRSELSPSTVGAAIRRQVQALDPGLPVTAVQSMAEVVDRSVAQPRFRALLLALFAAMAVVLAGTGIFGVISYSVASRTREIGIRVALGAQRGMILGMILRETLILTASGMAVGIPAAMVASRLLRHMLFGVPPHDPATVAVVAAGLVCVAILAAYVPARSALRVDAIVALRQE
ncbi:MAG: ABC transporter permease [Acidobacteriota bacterium]|nr:ABC transporter permease [Acidobacteriota bacterium]